MIGKLKEFQMSAYRDLLELLGRNYEIIRARDVNHTKIPFIVLRHDIDGFLDAAFEMAELEYDMGVKSTYYVLFSCPLYNPLAERSIKMLRKMVKMGHEIGLHYDLSAYFLYKKGYEYMMKKEVRLLEGLINDVVVTISCHNISTLSSRPSLSKEMLDISDLSMFENYVSDSNRMWNENSLNALIGGKYGRNMLLIHPMLWGECRTNDRYYYLSKFIDSVKEKWIELWKRKDRKEGV